MAQLSTLDHILTMSITRFTFCILLVASVCWTGCERFASHSNPLEGGGWRFCFSQDPKFLGQAIVADYQDYIQKLPPGEKKYASYYHDYEDGAGQHAVTIGVNIDGTEWTHVLIYDKDNKRIKAAKYISGHYRS